MAELEAETVLSIDRLAFAPAGGTEVDAAPLSGTITFRAPPGDPAAPPFVINLPTGRVVLRGGAARIAVTANGTLRVENVSNDMAHVVEVWGQVLDVGALLLVAGDLGEIVPGGPPRAMMPATPRPSSAPFATPEGPTTTSSDPAISAPLPPFAMPPAPATEAVDDLERATTLPFMVPASPVATPVPSILETWIPPAGSLPGLPPQPPLVPAAMPTLQLPAPGQVAPGHDPQRIARTLRIDGSGPCATAAGQVCQVGGDLAGSTGRVAGGMQWRVVVPAGRIPSGASATVFFPTTAGIEFFDCGPPASEGPTACTGNTTGSGLQGGTVHVYANAATVAQGPISGSGGLAGGPATPGPSRFPVYVTNSGGGTGNTVVVIDPSTNAVQSTQTVGTNPLGVAVHPGTQRAYVVNNMPNGTVSVIDTRTHQTIATVPVGRRPHGVAIRPDGSRLYVANRRSNNLSVIDTASNAVIATVPVGSLPAAVAVSPDGNRVYVANMNSDTVTVLDALNNTVIGTIQAGPEPGGLALDLTGSRLYVTNATDRGTVTVVDTGSYAILATVPVGPYPQGITTTGTTNRIYVVNTTSSSLSGSITVIDAGSNTVIATIPVGSQPANASATPDGSRVYVTNFGSNSVSVIDTAVNTVLATIPVGMGPFGVAAKP